MRFFVAMKELTHPFAAKLTQIDYDREMALVAEPAKEGEILGVARFFADPDNVRAEYAVAVRSDLKGHGLGYRLMTRLTEVARLRGIQQLFGDVLSENADDAADVPRAGFRYRVPPVRSRPGAGDQVVALKIERLVQARHLHPRRGQTAGEAFHRGWLAMNDKRHLVTRYLAVPIDAAPADRHAPKNR